MCEVRGAAERNKLGALGGFLGLQHWKVRGNGWEKMSVKKRSPFFAKKSISFKNHFPMLYPSQYLN